MIHNMRKPRPENGRLQRHVVITTWHDAPAPRAIAKALDAAGIEADVSVARVSPPKLEGRFNVEHSVRKTPTEVTITIPVEAARVVVGRTTLPRSVRDACVKALADDHDELRVGARVRRTAAEDTYMGRYGRGTVVRLLGGGCALVRGPNGVESEWRPENYEVIG